MKYKVNVNGKEIQYGPLVERSRFTDEEWLAIRKEMIKQHYSGQFDGKLDDDEFVWFAGSYLDLSDRYETLLELLPQSAYSKAGTHPKWVADAVNDNVLLRGLVADDVKDMINQPDNDLADLESLLKEYFEI